MRDNFAALFFLSFLILGCSSVYSDKSNHNDQVNSNRVQIGNTYEELKSIAEDGNQGVQELLLLCYEDSLNSSETSYRIYKGGNVIYGGILDCKGKAKPSFTGISEIDGGLDIFVEHELVVEEEIYLGPKAE
ncbi:hypothetical protein ACG9XS_06840 [Acinetobacter gyllenbergii]|uniref:hypothetical protein n=1 Tax=Acinetobacter gyllenbergii TaxID=134534 RepID=UPI0003BEA2E8|nr:hypothetical protein [Acinetobacter gyllenbergii]ESK48270.1 hypothetical protein F987_01755 [Acinetobacter gyllenbergii NIPH 230]